ncbi:hypothetical protein B0H21DRAFT_715361 [Amylocystis lapponica]|nr:hypothetical protein B0H21DRAFT_715361 [Amylocystis lapponica]
MSHLLRHSLSVGISPVRRCYSQASTAVDTPALDRWIRAEKAGSLSDTLRREHLSDLYISLPTRDGTARPSDPPRDGAPLGYGHHLVFFHPRNPERALRPDGSDQEFCPPEPFTRRMWAGGTMEWRRPLLIGDSAIAASRIASVEKKGFDHGSPKVFVKQRIEYSKEGGSEICVVEERNHVYLASPGNNRRVAEVDVPAAPHFVFEYSPSATTLFRFSALTFNGHHIHLDKEYAQKSEGYPERLVHGPLTALMLLELAAMQLPNATFKTFVYRAFNPMVVNRMTQLCGFKENDGSIRLWAEDVESGVVGMAATLTV